MDDYFGVCFDWYVFGWDDGVVFGFLEVVV